MTTSPLSASPSLDVRRTPPPPPPPAPITSPTSPTPVTTDLERGRVAATTLGLGTPRTTTPPPLPAVGAAPADPYSALLSAPELAAPAERSTIGRFADGLGQGVVAGVTGIIDGGVAAVTDPVGTARALGTAVGDAAGAARNYGRDLITSPRETIGRTVESARETARAVANATPEEIGRFIGENGVGLVGGAGAGAVVQRGARIAGQAIRATPDVPGRAPDLDLPPSPVARHGEALGRLGLDPTRVGRIADDLAAELQRTGGTSMGPARDGPRLAATHGGAPEDWVKVTTSARQLDTNGVVTSLPGQTSRGTPVQYPNGPTNLPDPTRGANHVFEVHAYRNARTGQVVEPKLIVERTGTPANLEGGRVAALPLDLSGH